VASEGRAELVVGQGEHRADVDVVERDRDIRAVTAVCNEDAARPRLKCLQVAIIEESGDFQCGGFDNGHERHGRIDPAAGVQLLTAADASGEWRDDGQACDPLFKPGLALFEAADLAGGDAHQSLVLCRRCDPGQVQPCYAKLFAHLGTGLFDIAQAEPHPLWFKELHGFRDHVPETEEYGIRSFVYRHRRPFDPQRLQAFIGRSWPGVGRAKGFFWRATRPDHVGELSQAGAIVRTGRMGMWWAAVPRPRWPDDPDFRRAMAPYLDPVWGDRRQEIVFIGAGPMDEDAIRAELDDCLLNATAYTPAAWNQLKDPFPPWG